MDSPWHSPVYAEQLAAITGALSDIARELRAIREVLAKIAGDA